MSRPLAQTQIPPIENFLATVLTDISVKPKFRPIYKSIPSHMYSTALIFEETFAQTVFAVVSCAVPGLSEFYSPVCFYLPIQGVRHSRHIPTALENS